MSEKLQENKAFYKAVLAISVPIMIQNGITNFVNLLDNIMVGRMGTLPMSAVSISNQLIFVFNLALFGGLSGAGIFTSQFFGKKDFDGVQQTIRFKVYTAVIILAVALRGFAVAGPQLVGIYLKGGDSARVVAETRGYAMQYINIMLIGFIPFCANNVLATTLRECGETKLPMKAGVVAIFVNLVFNYLLIFGNFGFPQLGVRGAAIATVLSRFVEFSIVFFTVRANRERFAFFDGLFASFAIRGSLTGRILKKGAPLMANETLWSVGISMVTRCYSLRGIQAVAAYNITTTIFNLFKTVYLAMGTATAIMLGHQLGAGNKEEAFRQSFLILKLCFMLCIGIGASIAVASPFIPQLYNTAPEIRALATKMLLICAVFTPVQGIIHVSYFVIRSGGKTLITFLFDAGFVWAVMLPTAYVVTHFTSWGIVLCYLAVYSADVIKCLIGVALINKKIWLENIVDNT